MPVIDTFQFANAFLVPATVSFKIEWEATGQPEQLGSGNAVPATDPAAFLGTFAPARSTGQFSGAELGFSFASKRGASTDRRLRADRNGTERSLPLIVHRRARLKGAAAYRSRGRRRGFGRRGGEWIRANQSAKGG